MPPFCLAKEIIAVHVLNCAATSLLVYKHLKSLHSPELRLRLCAVYAVRNAVLLVALVLVLVTHSAAC